MFFSCFLETSQLPDGWRLSHLWRIQSLVAGLLFSELEGYRRLQSADELYDVLLRDFEEVHLAWMLSMDAEGGEFEDEIRAGVRQYLKTESESLFLFCKQMTRENLCPVSERIVHCAKVEPEFADFLKTNAQHHGAFLSSRRT